MNLLPFFGCNNSKTSDNSSDKDVETKVQPDKLDTTINFSQNQFSKEKIIEFGDSIISYFKEKAGYIVRTHETTIDTFKTEQYIKTTITVRTNEYKTHGLISYDIFTFSNNKEAIDFFNDLKTQELIVPFGLNKRPNHILLDSNQVFWHHLEHPYGHRLKELTQIFNTKFNFHPNSTNLDSVSGFTYCRCKNNDVTITGIKRKWKIIDQISIWSNYSENNHYHSDCVNIIADMKEINLREDSISINGISNPIKVTSSINLPDNRLFWKYYFSETDSADFNREFAKKIEKIKNFEESLTLYEIKLTNHCYISFIKLEKGKAYMIIDNNFYTLTR